ncbi:MAG: hypothetical protein WAN79_02145, partial [Opitutaceae bacterium]
MMQSETSPADSPVQAAEWVERLAAFLRAQGGLKAVKVNSATRTAAVAAINEIDFQLIRAELDGILRVIDASRREGAGWKGRLSGGI